MPGQWANRPSATTRGYGWAHRQLRKALTPAVATGTITCTRYGHPQHPDCPGLITPGTAWELGHDDEDRSKYTGPEHAECNQRAGRLKANRVRLRRNRPAEAHPGLIV